MKRKFRLVLAMVLAMTMVMGMSISVMALPTDAPLPQGCPESINECTCADEHTSSDRCVCVYGTKVRDSVKLAMVALYDNATGQYKGKIDELLISTYLPNGAVIGRIYHINTSGKYVLCACNAPQNEGKDETTTSSHVHNFQWQTITEPTKDADGLEGEACACGATRNTQVISAYAYAMEQYAYNKVADTGAGNTCVLEMGTMDTYPKHFMEKIAPSVLRGVTVELRFKSNQKLTKIQIPGGNVVDTSCDWYGVNKLKELYTEIQ